MDGKKNARKRGRSSLVNDEMVKKIKDVIIGSHLANKVSSQKMVFVIGTGVVKTNEPKILRKFDGSLEVAEGWARKVLKDMDWVKRKRTTGKVESCSKFLEEEKFTFQRAISKFVSGHDIPLELVLNLDQTPLSYVSPRKYTFDLKDSKAVPIKSVNNKQQITVTFKVTVSGSFLPIQFIYNGKTKRCIPKYDFLLALMLPSLQIIGPIMKNVSNCLRKSSFSTLKPRKKSLVTQRSRTHRW